MSAVLKPRHLYYEQAYDELHDEFAKDEGGVLDDAFDGELYQPLRDLGFALADEFGNAVRRQEAIDAFQREVRICARAYADRHVYDRARSLMEADRA